MQVLVVSARCPRLPAWRVPGWLLVFWWLARGLFRLTVLAVRYWWLTAPAALALWVRAEFGGLVLAGVVLTVAAGCAAWWRWHPSSWLRFGWYPLVSRVRALVVYRRRWTAVMATCGLATAFAGDRYVPQLLKVRCDRYADPRQVQFVHAVLRNALQHAMREELVSRNVAKLVRVPSPRYKVGKGLSVDQVRKTLLPPPVTVFTPSTSSQPRWACGAVSWSASAGRMSTWTRARTLQVQQTVQRVAGRLHVLDAKTEDSEAVLPLPEVTWLTLMEHQERQQAERAALAEVWEDHDLVFPSERGTPMEPTNLSRSFARLREAAGLPGIRLHDLRHTVVSLLMELGVPPHVVQAIARHADVKITLKVYAHANLDAMRQALGKLDGRLS